MRRAVTRILSAVALLLILLLLAAAALVSTGTGLQLLWSGLSAHTAPALSVDTVEGRLAGSLRLQGVRYRTDQVHFSADELRLEWRPLALLRGTLHVREIAARGVYYRTVGQAPATDEPPAVLPERIELPLAIVLEALSVDEASLALDAEAEALPVDSLRLALRFTDSRLELERLELRAPDLGLDATVTLETAGAYPVTGELTASAGIPDYASLEASARIEGTLQQLGVRLELAPPYAATAELQLTQPFDAPQLRGNVRLQATDLAAIHAAWPALRLDATLQAAGTPERLQLEANLGAMGEPAGALQASLAGVLQPDALLLETLTLTASEGQSRLQANGRIDFGTTQPVVELQANWQGLAWPLQGAADISSREGHLALTGVPDAWELDAGAQLDVPGITAGRVQVAGRGDRQAFEIASLMVEALEGRVDGHGRLDWQDGLRAALDLEGTSLNPAGLLPEWPGRLDLRLQARLQVGEEDWRVNLDHAEARGTLRDLPLKLDGRGSYRPGQLVLRETRLQSGSSRLSVDGEIGPRLALDWALDSPDLATLLPSAAGRLAGSGKLQGTPEAAHVVGQLSGSRLRYGEDRIEALSLDASVDLSGRTESHLELSHGDGLLAGVAIHRLKLQGRGYPRAHRLGLTADTAQGRLKLQIEGDWQAPDWRYRMTDATLALPDPASAWNLDGPVKGRISAVAATLPEACWRSGEAMVCLRAARERDGIEAGFRLEALPLADLLYALETDHTVTVTLGGSGELRWRAGQPLQASASLQTTAGQLVAEEDEGSPQDLLFLGAGSAGLQVDGRGARVEARLPVEGGGLTLQAALDHRGADWLQRGLSGSARLQLPDLAFAGRLHPEISRLRGRLDGEVRLGGSLAAPVLLGNLVVADGEAVLATPGLTIGDIRLEVRGEPDGQLRLEARARSGEGRLTLDGHARLAGEVPSAGLRIQGEAVQVLNTPEAEILASPDLELALAGRRVDVTGKIKVPRARIEPRKLPESAVTVSGDQVIVTDTGPVVVQEAYRVYSRVRFVLGDDVRFEGLGLKGKLKGNLQAVSEPERPATATGELAIRDGRYRAYGQDLEIRTGRLLFAGGPVTEPGLDVEAVRRPAADVLVGVRVRGTLENPQFALFSEPVMAQSRQLSWLVLGRDLETNASDEERSAMNEAALLLGLSGGELLGKRLGEKVGVDEISIENEPGADTTQASLLVGKYLTPELFVSYGIGLFEPVSTLRLVYTLTSRWKLVGEASALRSSADVFYVIERGE